MVIVTEEIDLPTAQPKSFQLPVVSPSNDVPIPQSKVRSPKHLSLGLRMVTPDKFKNHNKSGGSTAHSRKGPVNSIELQQKMEDEFYDGPTEIEQLDDGELPSLSHRTPSNPRSRSLSRSPAPRAVTALWNQDDEEVAAAIHAKTASDAALADSARKRMATNSHGMDDREFERIKIAGFWCQLDEESEGEEDTGPRLKTIHHDEEPDDERQWRQGSARRRRNAPLDLHTIESGDETTDVGMSARETYTQETKSTQQSQWNLVEKAACFASNTENNQDQNSAGSRSDQSLDRTYQTPSHAGVTYDTATRGSETTMKDDAKVEEDSIFNCLTDTLGTICGYSTYVGGGNVAPPPSNMEKKERALAIIEKDRQRRDEDNDSDEDTDEDEGNSDHEEAAIELEYISRDDKEEAEEPVHARDNMATNTVVAGVATMGAAGLVAATFTANSAHEEMPLSPKSDAKKKRLTVKAVKNLLGLRKKKEAVNEETPNLAAVMTSSAKSQSQSHPADDDDDDMPEMDDVDDDSIFTDNEDDSEPTKNPTLEESTLGGLNSYNQDEKINRDLNRYQNRKPNKNLSIFDEEELESQAAGWDNQRKNAYLRELSKRAKQEYRAKKSVESHPDPDLTAGVTTSTGAAALGIAAVGVGAAMMNRVSEDDKHPDSPTEIQDETASVTESKAFSNVDYNSLDPFEKRKFLRLLNSGMSPQEATQIILDEREGNMPALEDVDEVDDDQMIEEEDGFKNESQDNEEEREGNVLEVESGESAEPTMREVEETVQEISRSEKATAGGTSHDAHIVAARVAGTAAVAAMTVPAIIRAKSRKSPGQYGDDECGNEQQQEDTYERDADGLVSVGETYYDSLQTSYEQEDVDNTLLLEGEKGKKSKKISKKQSVSTSFAKVASRRSLVSPRSGSNKFTSVNESSVAQQHFSRPNGSRSIAIQDEEPIDDIISPGSEASTLRAPKKFTFMHRSSKWAKVGSNLDADESVAPTVEEEQKEFYYPTSAPVRVEDTRSPMSIPDDETPGAAHTYEKSSGYESLSCQPPSAEAIHVVLPSLLPANDVGQRNVVTPTNEMSDNEEILSPAHSAAETASGANSLFMSPDTFSPTSPRDFDSMSETPPQHDQESREVDRASPFQSIDSPAADSFASRSVSQKPAMPRSAGSSPDIPFIPGSPADHVITDETDGHSITNYSVAEQSFLTLGTTCTKPSRRRHKGAAGKRLMEAKEAETHANAKNGWVESIRDVAAMRGEVWDPEKGWHDYSEPEPASNFGETKPIGSLHLTEKISQRKEEPVVKSQSVSGDMKGDVSVQFSKNLSGDTSHSVTTDEFTSDASTINTSIDTAGLMHNAAPVRRAKPKKHSLNTRKASTTVPERTVGWKESMEAATAQMADENRQWNYEEGWVENKDFADDVSELTRTTLERTPGSEVDATSPTGSVSLVYPSHFLPSVAEGTAESSSQAEDDALAEDRAIQEITNGAEKDQESGVNSIDSEYESEEEEFDVDAMIESAVPAEDSDKENDLSHNSMSRDSEDDSPKLATEEFPLKQAESQNRSSNDNEKPPMPKRSLNQWLEKSQKDHVKGTDVESENAVNSRGDTNHDSLDDVQVDEGTRSEINVIKERCNDDDNNLFQNVSSIEIDSDSRVAMESFESADSSEDEWLSSLSPKEKDGDDENNVSSRAMAWMSSMEKKSSSYKPAPTQGQAISAKSDPPLRTKADPPQNIDPPSIVSERVTTKMIASRFGSSTLGSSNSTTPTSNQPGAPKSRVEQMVSKLENPNQQAQSSQSKEEIGEIVVEHDVIFHSNAMGIRLKRGEDGLVRVVSVTESSPGSTIVREGRIEPDDILREAAGADLRSPITNKEWGEIVQVIRNASRPMKFVITSTRKQKAVNASNQTGLTQSSRSIQPSSATQKPPQILFGGGSSVSSISVDKPSAKQSILNRLVKCAIPEHSEKIDNSEGNEVPMAHLAFLRTNPTIARVRNEASRRYPALCGRPDTIFEEPEGVEAVNRRLSQRPSSIDRSPGTSYDGSIAATSVTGARTDSSIRGTSVADNVAYLERLTSKTAVSSKSTRTSNKSTMLSQGRSSPTGSNEVGWPDSDGHDTMSVSSYSFKSLSSIHDPTQKKDTARHAETMSESKVVAMMANDLQFVESTEECEI